MHSIKSKILSIYSFLIFLIIIVAVVSIHNLYSLNKAIDGLIASNYKSIVAASNMIGAIERQDSYELIYIQVESEESIKSFYENQKDFFTWLTKGRDNITEKEEIAVIDNITDNYMKYTEYFVKLKETKDELGTREAADFYYNEIHPLFLSIKEGLEKLVLINEVAMFKSKENATIRSRNQVYGTTVLSVFSIALGLVVAVFYTGKIVNPIKALINGIKSIKEGNLSQEIQISSMDEVGELAREFNNMTKRLLIYEKSNIKSLIAEKNKSLAIVKSISDPIVVTDNSCRISLVNKAAERVFEISEKDVIGFHILESINNKEILGRIKGAMERDTPVDSNRIIALKKNDKLYYYVVTVSPILGDENRLVGTITVLQDVTGLKEVEEMKSDFISTVSHELRTPLTSIIMGTGLLLDNVMGGLNEDQRDIVNVMDEDSKQLLSLVNDLLDISKIESGKMEINREESSISDIIRTSIKSFNDLSEHRGVKLYSEIQEGLPSIMIDANKIGIVINNLIANALKFTKNGDEIVVSAYLDGCKVYVSVSDTGVGIPEEFHEMIFDKFAQVEQTEFNSGGTGLGLAISKEFVQRHGGEIWVESEPGKGSRFIFTLTM
jgi:two-component system, NtrC family, sensor histidine kinase KinB